MRCSFCGRACRKDELVRLREEVDQRRGEWLRNAHSQLAQRVTESLAQAEGALQSLLLERERAEARCTPGSMGAASHQPFPTLAAAAALVSAACASLVAVNGTACCGRVEVAAGNCGVIQLIRAIVMRQT